MKAEINNENKAKCSSCPECGDNKYINKNLVGDGFRECRSCGQEWWIDIGYDTHIKKSERPKYLKGETIDNQGSLD